MDILQHWNLTPVINASGTMSSLGASRAGDQARAAVSDALGRFVKIDELQAAASRVIARATGAEAGYITSSSSAAITLGCAAAIAGEDLAAIEKLPVTGDRPSRVGLQTGHAVNYGGPIPQAIAASGAEVVQIGTAALCETYHLEAAIDEGLAAAVYVVSHHTVDEGQLPMPIFVEMCRASGVKIIVDMASEYDLRGPVALGADAVIYSGHKFLAGPTSGIVAGQRAMIRAMFLQNRGLGRLMKAGKEAVVGGMAALEAWQERDHAAERVREQAIVDYWLENLTSLAGVSVSRLPDWTNNPIDRVELKIEPLAAGLHAWELAARCIADSPAVAVRDDLAEHQLIFLDPCNVTMDEAQVVAARIKDVFAKARKNGDGCLISWNDEKRARGQVSLPWLAGEEQ